MISLIFSFSSDPLADEDWADDERPELEIRFEDEEEDEQATPGESEARSSKSPRILRKSSCEEEEVTAAVMDETLPPAPNIVTVLFALWLSCCWC